MQEHRPPKPWRCDRGAVYEGMPSGEERKKDYNAIRDYFIRSGIKVRLLGISGEMSIDQVSEIEMATFGWFKKR